MKQMIYKLINTGNRKDYSGSVQRCILMANIAALGGSLSLIFYAFIYGFMNFSVFQPVILVNIIAALFLLPVLYFNEKRHFTIAAVWLMVFLSIPAFINLRIYLGYRSGGHVFFILISLLPTLIIHNRKSLLILFLSGMEVLLLIWSYRYIPENSLLSTSPLAVIHTLETVTLLFVMSVIILIFYINQRIIDAFEQDLIEKGKRIEKALSDERKFASVDALTEILNRGHMEKRITEELTRGYRYGFPISLAMFDIDLFKNVNDTFGHDAGDLVLKKMASTVKTSIRETDTLGRWGGEEFMILLPYTNEMIAEKVAKKLCHTIEEIDHGELGKITASFGVAQWDGLEPFDRLYKRLDIAMYAAKEQGRNRVVTNLILHDFKPSTSQHYWRTDWESGHAEIDRQHRLLIERLNSFFKDEENSKEIGFLDLLIIDMVAHYKFEENLFLEIGYQDAEPHKILHAKLLKWLRNLRSERNLDGEYPQHAIHILEEAIITHILEEDTKYFPYLR